MLILIIMVVKCNVELVADSTGYVMKSNTLKSWEAHMSCRTEATHSLRKLGELQTVTKNYTIRKSYFWKFSQDKIKIIFAY